MPIWVKDFFGVTSLADIYEIERSLAPGVVLTRNNEAILTFALKGFFADTVSDEDVANQALVQSRLFAALAGASIYVHLIKRRARGFRPSKAAHPFCAEIDNARLSGYAYALQNFWYLSVRVPIKLPPQLAGLAAINATLKENLRMIASIQARVLASMKDYGPRIAGTGASGEDEQLSLFGFLMSGSWVDIPAHGVKQGLSRTLATSRVDVGSDGIVKLSRIKKNYVQMLALSDYPTQMITGAFNDLLFIDCPLALAVRFDSARKVDSLELIKAQIKALKNQGDAADDEMLKLNVLLQDVARDQVSMGNCGVALALYGDTVASVQHHGNAVITLLDQHEFQFKPADIGTELFFFGLSCLKKPLPNAGQITSVNCADMVPLHASFDGKLDGNPWGDGTSLLQVPLLVGSPFNFNFHVSGDGDAINVARNGHTLFTGITGSGKTVAKQLALLAAMRFNIREVTLDDRCGEMLRILAVGGYYKEITPGQRTGWNIFQWDATIENDQQLAKAVSRCTRILSAALCADGTALTDEEKTAIEQAARATLQSTSSQIKSMTGFDNFLVAPSGSRIKNRIKRWLGDGSLAWVLDNPLNDASLLTYSHIGFDLTGLLDADEARIPIIMMISALFEDCLNGQPAIFNIAEFAQVVRSPVLAAYIQNLFLTARKENACIVTDAQFPSQIANSNVGEDGLKSFATRVYFSNASLSEGEFTETCGENESHFRIVKELGPYSNKALIVQGDRSAVVSFALDPNTMSSYLRLLSRSKADIPRARSIVKIIGSGNGALFLQAFFDPNFDLEQAPWIASASNHV